MTLITRSSYTFLLTGYSRAVMNGFFHCRHEEELMATRTDGDKCTAIISSIRYFLCDERRIHVCFPIPIHVLQDELHKYRPRLI